MKDRCFEQADATQPFLVGLLQELSNPRRQDLRQHHAVDPRRSIQHVFHSMPFHPEAGTGSGDTARFSPRWLPAPKNDRGCFAGIMRTYGFPKRVTKISSPSAATSNNAACRRNERKLTTFMSESMSDMLLLEQDRWPVSGASAGSRQKPRLPKFGVFPFSISAIQI